MSSHVLTKSKPRPTRPSKVVLNRLTDKTGSWAYLCV